MPDVTININGGNNQILPNATHATQNFYGDRPAEQVLPTETPDCNLPEDAAKLLQYVDDREKIRQYIKDIATCTNAKELAGIIMSMHKNEGRITEDVIVKKQFINVMLSFASNITHGRSVDNVRKHINNILCDKNRR